MARSLSRRLKRLECATIGDWLEVRRTRYAIVEARLEGIIDEPEYERQLALFPDATPAHVRVEHDRVMASLAKERAALVAAMKTASQSRSPEQQQAEKARHENLCKRWDAERQEAISRDPSKWGKAYAVLIPDYVKQRTREVVERMLDHQAKLKRSASSD